jgi:hypothetical protein
MHHRKIILTIILNGLLFFNSYAQNDSLIIKNNRAIGLIYGTFLIYNSITLNYETKNLILNKPKHCLRANVGVGIWQANFITKNTGTLLNTNLEYIFGKKTHHFEADIGLAMYFDKAITKNRVSYLSTFPKAFIGYRLQNPKKMYYFKVGVGALDVFQIGYGRCF